MTALERDLLLVARPVTGALVVVLGRAGTTPVEATDGLAEETITAAVD